VPNSPVEQAAIFPLATPVLCVGKQWARGGMASSLLGEEQEDVLYYISRKKLLHG